ncbi:MAG TPA: TIR domain-containing protein [Steroidobacteraceae bacterium]|nr:TIR domain-containing protein [Steroidobacteraceae bacterium]
MTEPSRAVFLSYASEDAEAAERLADALRAAGIEVWFDRNALRGGDEWDRKIRREIKDCALFVPLISANSEARHEGYFRLEWDLADQRSHMIARGRPFLVPVGLDQTRAEDAGVPDSFQRVQWTWLSGGATQREFIERIARLLSASQARAPTANAAHAAPGTESPAPTASASRASSPPPQDPIPARHLWKFWGVAGAIALLVVLGLGYFALGERHSPAAAVGITAPVTAAAPIAFNSIAVLPLENLSRDPDQQYFSDGLSESLITALAQIPQLKVIGKSSSFLFRDSKESSHRIGERLGVAHLLVGSVERFGDQIRVSAELINTADGATVWSQQYDRAYKDLFALQDEITHAVAEALRAKLLPGESAATQDERPPSGSIPAYNALLQGRFYFDRVTESDLRKAIDFFTEATRIDPKYALAWAELGRTSSGLAGEFLDGAPAREANARARAATDKALALDPQLAFAHAARGYVLITADFNWRGAEAEYRRAEQLAPEDPQIQFQLGTMYATLGRVPEAIALTRRALGADPLRANWYNWLATYLSAGHRLEEAEQAIRKAIELQPTAASSHENLTIILIQRGEAAAALAAAQQEPAGVWQDVALTLARQVGPDRSAADAALKTLIEKDSGGAPYQIAEVYALRGDANATFHWLNRAWSSRDPGLQYLLFDPLILRYKSDPRFAAFCRKVGLPVPGET